MAGVMSLRVHRSHSLQIWGYQLFREQCHTQRPAHRLGPGGSSEEDALKRAFTGNVGVQSSVVFGNRMAGGRLQARRYRYRRLIAMVSPL